MVFHKVFQVSPFFSLPFSSASVHYQMDLAFNSRLLLHFQGYYYILGKAYVLTQCTEHHSSTQEAAWVGQTADEMQETVLRD